MAVRFCSATDMGRQRRVNQDALLADPDVQLFAIADGMGGHAGGDVASRLIIESLHRFVVDTQFDHEKTWPFDVDPQLSYPANRLKTAIRVANRRISEHLVSAGMSRGMGATLAAVLLGPDRAVVANVGDCRAYMLEDGVLRQVTRDHSWVAEQVESGFITADVARAHPWRHMVTRAIQGDSDLLVDTTEVEIQPGTRLLLCSDGIHVVLSDDEIAVILSGFAEEGLRACHDLISAANDRGGPDNVTAIVIEVVADKSHDG
jgi:protein phosphatase